MEIIGQTIEGQSLRGSDLRGAILTHSVFINTDLSEVDFRGAHLGGVRFISCLLRNAIFHYACLEGARFIDCDLSDCDFNWTREPSVEQETSTNPVEPYDDAQEHITVVEGYLYSVVEWLGSRDDLPPLVALHGMTGHAFDFADLARRSQRHTYAINLIGHGQSTPWPVYACEELPESRPRQAPDFLQATQHIYSIIQRSIGDQPFDLLGYSMGGRLALHLSILAKLRRGISLRRLIVLSASMGLWGDDERARRREVDRAWSDPLWEGADLRQFLQAWNHQPLLARLRDRAPLKARELLRWRSLHSPQGLAIAFDCLGLGSMPPLHEQLHLLPQETIWIYGEEDKKFEQIARDVAGRSPQIKILGIPHAGHAAHLEDLEAFWASVGDRFEA